uniref:Uncharacterized protein n=1 Tax=Salix viminalis TaxID=40686 RepID=A0A6N2KFB0_SALVM
MKEREEEELVSHVLIGGEGGEKKREEEENESNTNNKHHWTALSQLKLPPSPLSLFQQTLSLSPPRSLIIRTPNPSGRTSPTQTAILSPPFLILTDRLLSH